MTDIYIRYNPYMVTTDIKIDGEALDPESPLYHSILNHDGIRLQQWIEPQSASDWPGIFPALKERIGGSELQVRFWGTKADFEDLEYAKEKSADESCKITLIHENADTADSINPEERMRLLEELYEELQQSEYAKVFQTEEIQRAFSNAVSADFEIVVVAPLSSGKSTMINAIMGQDLLPAVNQATTAVITRIRANNSAQQFLVSAWDKQEPPKVVRCIKGDKGTYSFSPEGDEVLHWLADKGLIKALNDEKDPGDTTEKSALVQTIELEGPLPGIHSERLNTVFVDTPGGNNAQNEEHEELMDRAIASKTKSLILYVFNGTTAESNDNDIILEKIAEEMKRGADGKLSRDRFLFVANKMDLFKPEENPYGEYIEDAILSMLHSYEIDEPNLFPISAELCKLIRMKRTGSPLNKSQRSEYAAQVELFGAPYDDNGDYDETYCLYRHSSLGQDGQKRFDDEVERLLREDPDLSEPTKMRIAELFSGVPALEAAIQQYLDKYALCIKIKSAYDAFMHKVIEEQMIGEAKRKWLDSDKEWKKTQAEVEQKQQAYQKSQKLSELKTRISDIHFDRESYDRIVQEAMQRIDDIRKKEITSYGAVKVDEARKIVSDFIRRLQQTYEEGRRDVENQVEQSVIGPCQNILDEYRRYLGSVMQLDVGGIDFSKLTALQEFRVDNVDGLLKDYRETRYEVIGTKTVRVERKGILNSLRRVFHNEKGWDYQTQDDYGDVEYIRVNELIQTQINQLLNIFKKLTIKLREIAVEKIKEVKSETCDRLDKIDDQVKQIFAELQRMAENRDRLEKRAAETEQEFRWISDFNKRVASLMEIGGASK